MYRCWMSLSWAIECDGRGRWGFARGEEGGRLGREAWGRDDELYSLECGGRCSRSGYGRVDGLVVWADGCMDGRGDKVC